MVFLPFKEIVVLSIELTSKMVNPLLCISSSHLPFLYASFLLVLLGISQSHEGSSDQENPCPMLPEGIREGISIADAVGRITYVSKRSADMLGYTADEMVGRSIFDFVDPSILPQIEKLWARRKRGIGERKEIQYRRKDGSYLWAVVASNPLFAQNGEFMGLFSMITEITDSDKMGEFHRIAEEMFTPAFKASPDATAITRVADGKLIQCNKAFTQEFGYSSDEVIGHTTVELGIWPEGAREEYVKQLQEKGEIVNKELNMRQRDGSLVTMLLSSWLYNILDEPVLLTVARDITERKEAEEALRESEEKLRIVVANVPLVLFNIDSEGIFTLSEGVGLTRLGLKPGQVVGQSAYDVYKNVPEIVRVVDLALAGEPQHHEVDIFGACYEAWYNPVRNAQGEVAGLIGVATDITDRKKAEGAQQLYSDVVQNMQVGLYIYHLENTNDDRTLKLMVVNPASTSELGLHPENITGLYIDEVFPSLRDQGIPQRFADVVRTGNPFDVTDFVYQDSRLATGHFAFKVFPLPDNQVGVLFEDITDIKRAEEERRQFYRKTIEAATEGKLIITDRKEIVKMAGTPIAEQHIGEGDDLAKMRQMVTSVAQAEGLSEIKTFDLVLGAGEAAGNLLKHVGIGDVSIHSIANGLLLLVSDHGSGIPALSLPEVALKKSYTTAVSLGMGYKAMISIADHVYLATGPNGTTVAIEMMMLKQEHETSLLDSLPDTW